MLRPALPVALSLALALPARAQTTYDTIFQLKGLAPRADHVATVHGLVLHRDVMELRLESDSVSFVPPLEVAPLAIEERDPD